MSCEEIQKRLDALLDGDLEAAERTRVENHVRSCLPCSRDLKNRRRLLELARALPAVEPERDLWPGVAARIGGRRKTPSWALLAAAAALLIALAAPLLVWRDAPGGQRQQKEVRLEAQRADAARSRDGTIHTRNDLQIEIDRQRALLPPGALDHMEEDLRVLDRSVAQLAAALEEDPLNRHLSSQLATRYQQEADILKRISRI